MLLTNAARSVITERSIGLTMGHEETLALVDSLMVQAEGRPTRPKGAKKRATKTATEPPANKPPATKRSTKAAARSRAPRPTRA
jgi:hypothetical protein